ncbi:alpha/beta hydrolase [Deinococcus detaillensis]|uniref:Alpha/beta hydrolase n=1 Tax=Deinococcus detaillensis TaxID=2592048 RepID=A0A553UKV7_9DEIO|nr:alpha/beta fold hydrolase [Deinococcus detaillensis]TSA80832.1 alpha/beta hydrolase [Deinococcus detaillensis]
MDFPQTKRRVSGLTLVLLLGITAPVLAGGAGPRSSERHLTLQFGPVSAQATLSLPAGAAKAPLVLLIAGTGPEDQNGSYSVSAGQVVQGSLGALAQHLSQAGFAVMRFDKRYAAGTFQPQTAQAAFTEYGKLGMTDLLADARTALNAAKQQPRVDASKVFIYGWSEGSVIASSLALETNASGLIVQGPVVDSFADSFANQFERVGLAYLQPYSKDGKIDLEGVLAALYGNGSGLAKTEASLLLSLESTPQKPMLSTLLDTNKDGLIDLKAEALPQIRQFYQQFTPQSPMYAPATTLPTLGELAPRLKLPVLIMQGENDGNIDPAAAKRLNDALGAAGNADHTFKLYAGLGHSLGLSPAITQDTFAPMQSGPMNDMAAWLTQRSR